MTLRLGYGVPPTQLAVSFISHEYHYVGIFGDDMLWLWLWGLPQSDQIYIKWLFLEFIFSAPDFYLIKGEKTVSSL